MLFDTWLTIFSVLIFGNLAYVGAREVDVKKTLIFGPAFEADIVIPVRYFYIQAVDEDGKNFTDSLGANAFEVEYTANADRLRIWRELLDRHNGSYLVRFRAYNTYNGLTISVKYKGKHVADSPYKLNGPALHEYCDCPQTDQVQWTSTMKCLENYTQIEKDFERFPVIDLKKLREDGRHFLEHNEAVCHYSIISNKVYRRCPGSITDFKMFVDEFLFSLLRKVNLPDVEFYANLGDWPLERTLHNPVPIVSWCGSDTSADIIWPTYDLTQSVLLGLDRVSLDMMTVQANTGPKWEDKINKAVFRGRDSRQERLDLVVMGRKKPEIYDVALSNFFFFKYEEEKYGPMNRMSFFDFFNYKYQLNIDGTVAAYRLPYLLAGGALVLKQDSEYYEHFYTDLKPWVHYVPFKRDLSDLEEKILWARSHDEEARTIALAGQRFALDNLMPANIYCYSYRILEVYAKRQTIKPERAKGMEYVKMPENENSHCHCHRKKTRESREEL